MQIPIPLGFKDLTDRCKCDHDHEDHDCFMIARPSALRGFCPPCFEYRFVDPKRLEVDTLHTAFHNEMTRINGWRIKNEKSFEKADRNREIGGRPYPNNFKNEVI